MWISSNYFLPPQSCRFFREEWLTLVLRWQPLSTWGMDLLEMVYWNDEVYGSNCGRCPVFIHDFPYSPWFQWLPSIQRVFILVVLYRTAWTCMAPSSNPTAVHSVVWSVVPNWPISGIGQYCPTAYADWPILGTLTNIWPNWPILLLIWSFWSFRETGDGCPKEYMHRNSELDVASKEEERKRQDITAKLLVWLYQSFRGIRGQPNQRLEGRIPLTYTRIYFTGYNDK
jgi:hypothetical protein